MKGIINLLLGLFGIGNIIYHFVKHPGRNETIFGFEVNEYVYLLFWGVISVTLLLSFYRTNKKPVS